MTKRVTTTRDQIVQEWKSREFCSYTELAAHFCVSVNTVKQAIAAHRTDTSRDTYATSRLHVADLMPTITPGGRGFIIHYPSRLQADHRPVPAPAQDPEYSQEQPAVLV